METWRTNYICNFIEAYIVKFLYKIGALLSESTSDFTAIVILGILNFQFSLKMKAIVIILSFNFCFLTILAGKLPKVLTEDDTHNKQVFFDREAPSARGRLPTV